METIPAYEVQLQEEADCNEAIWCKLVTGHTTVTIGVVYRCPNITKQNNEKIHNAISEVSKEDCIIMGGFNHGNIKWDTVFEIALVRLSETSDYLLGQVNNPLAVIRRTSGNLQQYFMFHYHFIIMQS